MHLELDASAQASEQVTLQISHEDLAALVFSRRQYITAILGRFVASGMIENRRQQLRVLDVERLMAVVAR
jgi:hypothetical protein